MGDFVPAGFLSSGRKCTVRLVNDIAPVIGIAAAAIVLINVFSILFPVWLIMTALQDRQDSKNNTKYKR